MLPGPRGGRYLEHELGRYPEQQEAVEPLYPRRLRAGGHEPGVEERRRDDGKASAKEQGPVKGHAGRMAEKAREARSGGRADGRGAARFNSRLLKPI